MYLVAATSPRAGLISRTKATRGRQLLLAGSEISLKSSYGAFSR